MTRNAMPPHRRRSIGYPRNCLRAWLGRPQRLNLTQGVTLMVLLFLLAVGTFDGVIPRPASVPGATRNAETLASLAQPVSAAIKPH